MTLEGELLRAGIYALSFFVLSTYLAFKLLDFFFDQ